MAGVCCLCGAGTERGKGQNLVEYGNCDHLEHLQCILRQNTSGSCEQCRKDRNKKGPDTSEPPIYLLGAYADPEYLRGGVWNAWLKRVRNAPVDFTTALQSCPIAKPGGGLPLPKTAEIQVMAVDPKDLVLAGHPDESRSQGMVRMTLTQKRRILDIIEKLNGNQYPLEILRASDITFSTLKRFIVRPDGSPCSFLVWKERTGLSPGDLVALGAKFRDLVDCGLNKNNANSQLISPSVYLDKPLFTQYGEIYTQLCGGKWKDLFRIAYSPRQLLSMGITPDEMLHQEIFAWEDYRFFVYLGIEGACDWGMSIEYIARIYADKYTGEYTKKAFVTHFCTELMRWKVKECATYLRVRFTTLPE